MASSLPAVSGVDFLEEEASPRRALLFLPEREVGGLWTVREVCKLLCHSSCSQNSVSDAQNKTHRIAKKTNHTKAGLSKPAPKNKSEYCNVSFYIDGLITCSGSQSNSRSTSKVAMRIAILWDIWNNQTETSECLPCPLVTKSQALPTPVWLGASFIVNGNAEFQRVRTKT